MELWEIGVFGLCISVIICFFLYLKLEKNVAILEKFYDELTDTVAPELPDQEGYICWNA